LTAVRNIRNNVDLFRRLYLVPTGNAFYKSGFKKSPKFHYDMVHDLGQWARNAEAAELFLSTNYYLPLKGKKEILCILLTVRSA
jgi:hypothetical protein